MGRYTVGSGAATKLTSRTPSSTPTTVSVPLGHGLAIVMVVVLGGIAAASALGPRLAVALVRAEPDTLGVVPSAALVICTSALLARGVPAMRPTPLDPPPYFTLTERVRKGAFPDRETRRTGTRD